MRETIERTPRFAERVFTAAERAYCESRGAVAAQHYAARFAAKEAALKALQTGWSGGISWQDVEVSAKESGAPLIIFYHQELEKTQKKVVDLGGKVTKEIFEFPGGRRFHIREPGGGEFAIWSDK